MTEISRPLPDRAGTSGEFYGYCAQGELRFQRCTACGAWRHVPRELCASCGDWGFEWVRSSGRGEVFSWTVVDRALHPAFVEEAPFAAVVVELEEGVRLLTRIPDVAPADLEIGMGVEVAFEKVADDVTLPYFRRA